MSETANPSTRIHHVSGPKRLLIAGSSQLMRVWQDTLQYRFSGDFDHLAPQEPEGQLILLWHNRLFMGIGALRRTALAKRKLYALVSASRDGAKLSEFLKGLGIEPIRGSSSRRGAVATRELLKVLADGNNVAITVDGPRGPCYKAQPGAALLMQLTGAPAIFVGAESECCHTLRSWDRFIVPMPFSRVNILLHRHLPETSRGKDQRAAMQSLVEEGLSKLTLDLHEPR